MNSQSVVQQTTYTFRMMKGGVWRGGGLPFTNFAEWAFKKVQKSSAPYCPLIIIILLSDSKDYELTGFIVLFFIIDCSYSILIDIVCAHCNYVINLRVVLYATVQSFDLICNNYIISYMSTSSIFNCMAWCVVNR